MNFALCCRLHSAVSFGLTEGQALVCSISPSTSSRTAKALSQGFTASLGLQDLEPHSHERLGVCGCGEL